MLSGVVYLSRWFFDLDKARLGRPLFGFQTRPPRSSIAPDQPEWQLSAIY